LVMLGTIGILYTCILDWLQSLQCAVQNSLVMTLNSFAASNKQHRSLTLNVVYEFDCSLV
jgi:hypothetical protein